MGLGVLFCRCFFATVHRFSYVYTPIIKASKLSRKNTTNQCGILTHPTAQKTTPTKKPPNVAHVIKARSSSRVGVAVRQARDWLYPAQQLNCVFLWLTKLFVFMSYKIILKTHLRTETCQGLLVQGQFCKRQREGVIHQFEDCFLQRQLSFPCL